MTLCGCDRGFEASVRMVFYEPDWEKIWSSDSWGLKRGDKNLITGIPEAVPKTDQIAHEYLWCLECAVSYRSGYGDGDCFDIATGREVDLWLVLYGESEDGLVDEPHWATKLMKGTYGEPGDLG